MHDTEGKADQRDIKSRPVFILALHTAIPQQRDATDSEFRRLSAIALPQFRGSSGDTRR
jgi:hypothetical protein